MAETHLDVVRAQLAGQATGEAIDGELGGVVRLDSGTAENRHQRRDVDNFAPTLCLHDLSCFARANVRPAQVEIDHKVKVFRRRLEELRAPSRARYAQETDRAYCYVAQAPRKAASA